VDIYTVSRLFSHPDIRTAMIYVKVQVEVLEEAMPKLDLCYKERKTEQQQVKNCLERVPGAGLCATGASAYG